MKRFPLSRSSLAWRCCRAVTLVVLIFMLAQGTLLAQDAIYLPLVMIGNDGAPAPEVLAPTANERYAAASGEIRTLQVDGAELTYEVIDGLAIYQGDMILGPADELEGGQVEASGVGRPAASCMRVSGTLRCLFGGRLWPNGVVPYAIFSDTYPDGGEAVKELIEDVADHYAAQTNLRLVERTVERDYVQIRNITDPRVCGSSDVGRQGGAQRLHLRSNADLGCAVHEFGHAVGLLHEQSRSDRDEHVRINWGNLNDPALRHNFEIAPTAFFDDYGYYDYDSLMHYRAFIPQWSSNPAIPLIQVLDPGVALSRLGQRTGLSTGDILTLNEMYPADVTRVDLREFQTPGLPSRVAGSSLRNQGGRGTCITFAAIAALEAAYKRQGYGSFDLSEEFINYMGKVNWLHPNWNQPEDTTDDENTVIDDTNGNGVPDEHALMDKGANYREGQLGFTGGGGSVAWLKYLANGFYATEESAMPYVLPDYVQGVDYANYPLTDTHWLVQKNTNDFNLNPANFTRNHSPGVPDARKVDQYFSIRSSETICGWDGAPACSSLTPADFENVLKGGTEIAIDFKVAGDTSGPLWRFDPAQTEVGDHAMLLVGFDRTDPANPYFIVKNSWGPTAGGVGGDCGEDGYTCIAYDYLSYLHSAAHIIEVNPPRDWDHISFIGRWDLSFDGWHGTLDITHMPGTQDAVFENWPYERYPDHRVGAFYDAEGNAFRVNGAIEGNRLDFYIDSDTPNLRWDQLSGRHFTYYLFADDGDTMAGFHTDPDGRTYAGYARRTFDGSGFLAEQTNDQDLTTNAFLGHWQITAGYAPVEQIDLHLQEISRWSYVDAGGREYAQLLGYSQALGSDTQHEVIALVPLDETTGIQVQVMRADGSLWSLRGKRLTWERNIFAGAGNGVAFYALKQQPSASLTIVTPLTGSSFPRGRASVSFSAAATGFATTPMIRWESDRDGLIGESTASVATSQLSVGVHTVTASTGAPDGSPLTASITLTITNDAPRVTLVEPTAANMPLCGDTAVTFRAEVYDSNDGSYESVPNDEIVWRLNGETIGTGRTFSRSLPVVSGDLV
nr:M12 family metallopeptidase [Caldilineaceae bacterium]